MMQRRRPEAGPQVSFEFFPPKNEEQAAQLDSTLARLARWRPAYASVTYGAGGTSQERSLGAVKRVRDAGYATAAHLTCAGASRDALAGTIRAFRAEGIENFVALRGDPPGGLAEPYRPHPDGYRDTADLVRELKEAGAREVSVSAYPERHPQSPDWEAEISALKRKVDAGADSAITQFFFGAQRYERYLERVRRAGIKIPIAIGIMPIHRFASVAVFAGRCGATVPPELARRFEGLDPESEAHRRVAAEVVVTQVRELMDRGADSFHVYTLNRAELTESLCRACGIVPEDEIDRRSGARRLVG